MNDAVSGVPRPYGGQPVALRELSESIAYQLERELRAAGAADSAHLFVKAFWLCAGDERYGWPDYAYAYVWVAPAGSLWLLIRTSVARVASAYMPVRMVWGWRCR